MLFRIAGVLLMVVTGCQRQSGDGSHPASPAAPQARSAASSGAPRLLRAADLTDNERRWGVSPTRNSAVTYQPGVILVENGSDAVRGLSADGLTWRVDADEVPAAEIQPGKVIFLTSRAVGRILSVTRQGGELGLLLGPVELGDVIRDCDIEIAQAPVDFGAAQTYTVAEMPGESVDVPPIVSAEEPRAHYASWRGDTAPRLLPVQTGAIKPFTTQPIASLGTLGVKIAGNSGGTKLVGEAALHLLTPRLSFHLAMKQGSLVTAELALQGAAGLTLAFTAVSEDGKRSGINQHVQVPSDISIPIGGPLPFTVTVRQQFIVQTVFGAPGTLDARGDYLFAGSISVNYDGGRFTVGAPTRFSGQNTLLDSASGASLGVSAVSLTHQVKVIGGFGAFGFAVGPYVFLSHNVNVTRHSDLDTLARCVFTNFTMDAGTGVGYVVPQPVVKFINAILSALNLGQIRGEGGIQGPRDKLITAKDFGPKSPVCEKWSNQPAPGGT